MIKTLPGTVGLDGVSSFELIMIWNMELLAVRVHGVPWATYEQRVTLCYAVMQARPRKN